MFGFGIISVLGPKYRSEANYEFAHQASPIQIKTDFDKVVDLRQRTGAFKARMKFGTVVDEVFHHLGCII